jgi:ribonuclease-3
MDLAKWWLKEVMKPLIVAAYEEVRVEHGLTRKVELDESVPLLRGGGQSILKPNPAKVIPQLPTIQTSQVGHLSLLNQHCQQKDLNLEWRYCDVPGGTKATPIWTADAFVAGEYVGTGQGHTKKAARNEAAKQGLKFLGIVLV